jgi:hypothetical protein
MLYKSFRDLASCPMLISVSSTYQIKKDKQKVEVWLSYPALNLKTVVAMLFIMEMFPLTVLPLILKQTAHCK